ncbi:hypothetical protein KAR34_13755 [bacterium]|nr:hypothetical protein [bacterium]
MFISKFGIVFLLLLLTINTAQAGDAGIGVKMGFSGGPCFSAVGELELDDTSSLNLSIGGFPGIILRVESNYRYTIIKKWSPFIQAGIGYWEFFRGRGEGQGIIDLHLDFGISKSITPAFDISANIGIIYIPAFINPWFKEEFSDGIAMVPAISFEIIYSLPHNKP